MFTTEKKIILASGSPRRQAYMNDIGLDFKVSVANIDEDPWTDEDPRCYVCRMARQKAMDVMEKYPESWVVSADTTVSINDKILGKPENADDAVITLMLLSGKEHEVATAFCLGLKAENVLYEECVITKVRFSRFTEATAKAYVKTGEYSDKAGAYGIQGKGAFLVSGVCGSYSNVVGLPLCELLAAMKKFQIVGCR